MGDSGTVARRLVESATQPAWPVRALWTWPVATAAVLTPELAYGVSRQGVGVAAATLALASALAFGTWLGVLHGLIAVILRRRGVRWGRSLSVETWSGLAGASVVGVIVAVATVAAVPAVLRLSHAYPVDYDETATALWRGGLWLTVPLLTAGGVWLARWVERRARDSGRAVVVTRVALTVGLALLLTHFGSGSFFIYFGAPMVLALLALSAAVLSPWMPAWVPGARGAVACLMLLPVLGAGFAGLHHIGARALLLHDARIAPHVARLALGWLDGDGDGDLPPYLGGGDCDDDDPEVSIAVPEVPGNGIDDNCVRGDALPRASGAPARRSDGPRPPIVLVSIDTVRADHLELYGYERDTMPALAALGARGLVFERAYAPANHTFYSMMALLSGQSPEAMLAGASGGLRYTQWLPETLRRLGYYVVAINSPLVVDGKLSPEELRADELEVGTFDYVGKNRGTTAKQAADAAIRRVQNYRGEQPLALWIHFMDPHAVHESPARFPVQGPIDAYDNELSWVDMHLSRLLVAVEQRWGDGAVVIVTADHGEEFGETGDYGHGFRLRDRELHVPLVLKAPGVGPGRRVEPVSLLAVAPTVLDLLGQPEDPRLGQPSLLGGEVATVVAENPAFLWNEARMEAALIETRLTLVWCRTRNTLLLFDKVADPQEAHNLAVALPEERERMLGVLQAVLEARR